MRDQKRTLLSEHSKTPLIEPLGNSFHFLFGFAVRITANLLSISVFDYFKATIMPCLVPVLEVSNCAAQREYLLYTSAKPLFGIYVMHDVLKMVPISQ